MKLLLTGFEPFGNSPINPSEQLVQQLANQPIDGVELTTAVLPVERFAGPDLLIRTYISAQPDVVLCLGEAGGNTGIAIERVAINVLDFPISDNGGHLVTDKPIVSDGQAAYFSTLPVRTLVNQLKEQNIPAYVSNSAGTFLCNQVMYEILHHIAKHQLSTRAGFIHLPWLPEQSASKGGMMPSMGLPMMVTALTAVIQTLADHG